MRQLEIIARRATARSISRRMSPDPTRIASQ
jgi:hypothetical protein